MKNDLSQTIFHLDLKHIHKYGSAKFQPNPLFSSQQMATEHAESVAEEKKSWQTHRGSRRDGMPQIPQIFHCSATVTVEGSAFTRMRSCVNENNNKTLILKPGN